MWKDRLDSSWRSFTEIMIQLGDKSQWLIANKEEFQTGYQPTPSCTQQVTIKKSSWKSSPYNLNWCKRIGQPQDPWVSVSCNHHQCSDIDTQSMIYGENGYHAWNVAKNNHNGSNIYIR